MTHGFLQQDLADGFAMPKAAATPQHGQKADPRSLKLPRPPRSPAPRKGH